MNNVLSGNPRAWTSVPGRFPSFLYIYYRDKRIAAHGNPCRANLAGPNDVRPFLFYRKEVFLVNLEHSFLQFLQKGGVP